MARAAPGIKIIISIMLRRMHEMQTIVTDVRGVCPSVSLSAYLSVTNAHSEADLSACSVFGGGVIRCSLCQMTLASCYYYT